MIFMYSIEFCKFANFSYWLIMYWLSWRGTFFWPTASFRLTVYHVSKGCRIFQLCQYINMPMTICHRANNINPSKNLVGRVGRNTNIWITYIILVFFPANLSCLNFVNSPNGLKQSYLRIQTLCKQFHHPHKTLKAKYYWPIISYLTNLNFVWPKS